jgi:uroporphyrinogen III methyltransferase/synthase
MSKSGLRKTSPSAEKRSPLAGKTVVVTRGRDQSGDIAVELEALGATVINCPTIEIAPPTNWQQLDESITRLEEYDWIVFTSANGVNFFFQRMAELWGDSRKVVGKQLICAIGPATARALERKGAKPNIIATDSIGEGALKAITDSLGNKELVRGLNFLIPRAKVARNVLPAGLRRLGARVDAVEAYQTVKPNVDRKSMMKMLTAQRIDVITFTSSSTVSNFADLLGLTDLSGLLSKSVVACIGPVTAKTAAKYGLRDTICPDSFNANELVKAIVGSVGQR